MIKLVAIDLDGTLLDPNRQITAEVKTAVKKAKAAGVKIVITTGRPLPGVVDILKALELTDQSDYVITYNGGLVQRATGEEFIKETQVKFFILHFIFSFIFNFMMRFIMSLAL